MPIRASTKGDDTLKGKKIKGLAGDDDITAKDSTFSRLYGNGDNDALLGGDNGAFMSGGSGADKLYAGLGKNILIGGKGKDKFVFDPDLADDKKRMSSMILRPGKTTSGSPPMWRYPTYRTVLGKIALSMTTPPASSFGIEDGTGPGAPILLAKLKDAPDLKSDDIFWRVQFGVCLKRP
ncbi:MAG: hypothetical protein MJA84_00690 [Firmicutes bacterium]|nr:hypothetical protein [Bacillota bacterium]